MPLSIVARYCLETSAFFSQDIIQSRIGEHTVNQKRRELGEFHTLYYEYRNYPDKFFEYTRASIETFDFILGHIHEDLKSKVNFKKIVSPQEQLFLTLRFLGHGGSFRSRAQSYRLGRSTVAKVIYQTLEAIWKNLVQIHMPQPTCEKLKSVANLFFSRWQFPNCLGAIDGKHFRIINPPNSGSAYYNYKKFFSLVLQGVSDADYKFIIVEVGGKGKQSDGGTFHFSRLNRLLTENRFNVPPSQRLPGSYLNLPYVLIGDEAYPLKNYLMRPYPSGGLNAEKRTFNKRLSRARVTIECAFGILTNKFRIFTKSIEANKKHATLIIKVSCLLHNIIRERDGDRDKDCQRFFSQFGDSNNHNSVRRSRRNNRATVQASRIRDQFKLYFNNRTQE